jgi:antitoxin VapB
MQELAMIETRTAKLFKNGASQAVRLPAEYRFEGDEVFIRRDPATGDVLLSSHPGAGVWADFFDLLDSIDCPADYLTDRPLNTPVSAASVFDDDLPG